MQHLGALTNPNLEISESETIRVSSCRKSVTPMTLRKFGNLNLLKTFKFTIARFGLDNAPIHDNIHNQKFLLSFDKYLQNQLTAPSGIRCCKILFMLFQKIINSSCKYFSRCASLGKQLAK